MPKRATPAAPRPKRADAQRNEESLLAAAAKIFVASGVEAPIRNIATAAGVGTATIYRHFPTRAELIIAVYRHQVDALAEDGPQLLAGSDGPFAALRTWVDRFVDFLATKHGLAAVLQSDDSCFEPLHDYFIERLVPVCSQLIDAARAAGEISSDIDGVHLMRAVGGLWASSTGAHDYDARAMVDLLVGGLRS